MSRIRSRITVIAAGAAAGLFLAALGSSASATADTTIPVNPGLGGLFEQVVASSATIPQQLLATTASTLVGSSPAPRSVAPAAGLSGLSALPDSLGSMLPFPMPNLGTTGATVAAPAAAIPSPVLIPGLP